MNMITKSAAQPSFLGDRHRIEQADCFDDAHAYIITRRNKECE